MYVIAVFLLIFASIAYTRAIYGSRSGKPLPFKNKLVYGLVAIVLTIISLMLFTYR